MASKTEAPAEAPDATRADDTPDESPIGFLVRPTQTRENSADPAVVKAIVEAFKNGQLADQFASDMKEYDEQKNAQLASTNTRDAVLAALGFTGDDRKRLRSAVWKNGEGKFVFGLTERAQGAAS